MRFCQYQESQVHSWVSTGSDIPFPAAASTAAAAIAIAASALLLVFSAEHSQALNFLAAALQ